MIRLSRMPECSTLRVPGRALALCPQGLLSFMVDCQPGIRRARKIKSSDVGCSVADELLQADERDRAGRRSPSNLSEGGSFWPPPAARQRPATLAARHRIVALAIVVGTWLVFLPALRNDFVEFDDGIYVTANSRVQQGLSLSNVLWAFSPRTTVASNWHPLTLLSHMLDCQWFGLEPAGHHATSVFLHGLNAGLLFWLLARATGAAGLSAWVAVMFAVHPLRVESVAWVAERKDVLSTFFWFAALAAYGHYATRPSIARLMVVALLLTLGLLAKPMLVTFPIVLLLLDVWPLRRISLGEPPVAGHSSPVSPRRWFGAAWMRLLLEKLPLFGIVAVFSLVTLWAQRSQGIRSLDQLPVLLRLTNALSSYAVYLWQTFVPLRLAAFYPHPANHADLTHLAVATIGLLLLVGMTFVSFRQRAERPYVAVGWLWYVVTLLPVIGLVQVGGQAHADRYTYVPQIGVLVLLAWLAEAARQRWPLAKRGLPVVAVISVLGVLPLTWHQIGTWHDTQTLFTHAVRVTDRNFLAYRALGNWAIEHGNVDEAMQHYRRVLELRPDDEQAYFDLAYAYHLKQQFRSALELYFKGLEKVEAKQRRGADSRAEVGKVHANVAQLLAVQGDGEAAIRHYRQAIEHLPTLAEAYLGLGSLLAERGKTDEALAVYRQGLMHLPQHTTMLNRLARVLATSTNARQRNGDEAVRLAQQACRLAGTPGPRLLDTLAAAYAEQGNFKAAIQTAQLAIRRAVAQPAASSEDHNRLAEEIARHLRRYQQHQPLREDPADIL